KRPGECLILRRRGRRDGICAATRQEEGYQPHKEKQRARERRPRKHPASLARSFPVCSGAVYPHLTPHPLATADRATARLRPRWRALGRGIIQHPTRLYASAPDLSITLTYRLLSAGAPFTR